MKKISIFVCATVVMVQFISCSKKDNTPSAPKDMIVGTWQYQSLTANKPIDLGTGRGPSTDLLSSCDKDNTITFKSDATYVSDDGADRCDTTGPRYTYGSWNIDHYPLLITTDNTGSIDTLTLSSLTASRFSYSETVYLNDTVNIVGVFVKK